LTEPAADPSYGELVWSQLRKRKLAMASLAGLLGLLGLAAFAPLIASNKPLLWRAGDGPWASPWISALFDRNFYENSVDLFFNALMVAILVLGPALAWALRRAGRRPRLEQGAAKRRVLAVAVGAFVLGVAALEAAPHRAQKVVYPVLQAELEAQGVDVVAVYPPLPWSFRDGSLDKVRQPLSWAHPLGTDGAGRDVLVRLLFGTRISLTIGVFAVALYVGIGIVLGAIAGYYGGRTDLAIQRLIEVVICIPALFLILTVASFIEQRSIFHIMVIIAAVSWTGPARLVRAEFLRLRSLDFVAAARACGYSEPAIIFREVLPNALGPVLVYATFGVARAILTESTMSFLGLGDITVPSWGQILAAGRSTGLWVMILAPGFAIFLTVSLLNLLGEGVRDALDPKLRR
jgi:peptide/nickel transport system permease protein